MGPVADRFFKLPELAELFLSLADTSTLINCMRVCRLWRDVIQQSRHMQEELFFVASEGDAGTTTFNPMLERHFVPVLGPTPTLTLEGGVEFGRAPLCDYTDLSSLPWAKDQKRAIAFTRKEASWRRMLVCQPPLTSLWHYFQYETRDRKPHNPDQPADAGGSFSCIEATCTIGMLWDLVEPLLVRGCAAQLSYYDKRGSAQHDLPSACMARAEPSTSPPVCGHGSEDRRIIIRTNIIWLGRALSGFQQVFDHDSQEWVVPAEAPIVDFHLDMAYHRAKLLRSTCVFRILTRDCEKEDQQGVVRWSKSAASSWLPYKSTLHFLSQI